jgi:hypothetical protein
MDKQPKRQVKWFKRQRGEKVYRYAWIGHCKRNKNGTPIFVREANISHLSPEQIEAIAQALRNGGEAGVPESEVRFLDSLSMGDTWAVVGICEDLGIRAALDAVLAPDALDAVTAMIVDRVINPKPHSKRALCDSYPQSALCDLLQADPIPLEQWYRSLGSLHSAQAEIETCLAEDATDGVFLYDITSSYFEGQNCPLAAFGYNRDGKKGKKQIVIGLLANSEGRPLALRVFNGNTRDDTTVVGWLDRLRDQFGAQDLVFVGDRGMVTSSIRRAIDESDRERIEYITALTRREIMDRLDDDGHPLQLGLFDHRGLAEIEHDGQRHVLCFNPEKQSEDCETRNRLLDKTEEKLRMVERNVAGGRWRKQKVIAARFHRWLDHWNMGRFFEVEYGPGTFSFRRDEEKIREWERLDGCYVILTTVKSDKLGTEDVRDHYKSLSQVEQAFRTMKTTDQFIRPIRHWAPDNVRGHVFMCMLAYLVIWEARGRFSGLLGRDPRSHECEGDSLREIWAALAEGVKVGTIRIGGQPVRQLAPLNSYTRKLLAAAECSIGASEKRRLRVA